ncbi:MAG: N-6 DNA methylase [Gallionellaceae bacterium]
MVSILFINDDQLLATPGTVRKLLDPACGTGGMLAEAQNYLREHHGAAKLPEGSYIMDGHRGLQQTSRESQPDSARFGGIVKAFSRLDRQPCHLLATRHPIKPLWFFSRITVAPR